MEETEVMHWSANLILVVSKAITAFGGLVLLPIGE